MGQCYDAKLFLIPKNNRSEIDCVESLRNFILTRERTNFRLDDFEKVNVKPNSLDDCLFILGYKTKESLNRAVRHQNGWYELSMNASYGWESVLIESFEVIAPFLKNGSYCKIYPDNGYDIGVVKEDKVEWDYSDESEDDE